MLIVSLAPVIGVAAERRGHRNTLSKMTSVLLNNRIAFKGVHGGLVFHEVRGCVYMFRRSWRPKIFTEIPSSSFSSPLSLSGLQLWLGIQPVLNSITLTVEYIVLPSGVRAFQLQKVVLSSLPKRSTDSHTLLSVVDGWTGRWMDG